MKITDQERQARSRKARAEAGGKQVAVMLSPSAVASLAKLQRHGLSISAAINCLLDAPVKAPSKLAVPTLIRAISEAADICNDIRMGYLRDGLPVHEQANKALQILRKALR